jgi:hypothetical protein
METRVETGVYERELLQVVRRLPAERVSEVIDFAQFLEFQMIRGAEGEGEFTEHDARWDALLATDESQRWLEKMADEVQADIEAGHTEPMVFTEDGEIAPG